MCVAAELGGALHVDIDPQGRQGIGGRVDALAAVQDVGAAAALQKVVALAALEDVPGVVAAQDISQGRAGDVFDRLEHVALCVAADLRGALHVDIDTERRGDVGGRVDPRAAVQDVGAAAAFEDVVAAHSHQLVRRGVSDQGVVAVAGDRVLDHRARGDREGGLARPVRGLPRVQVDHGVVDIGRGVDPVDAAVQILQHAARRVEREHFEELVVVVVDVIGRGGVAIDVQPVTGDRADRTGLGVGDPDRPGAVRQFSPQRIGAEGPAVVDDRCHARAGIQHDRPRPLRRDQLDPQVVDIAMRQGEGEVCVLDFDRLADDGSELERRLVHDRLVDRPCDRGLRLVRRRFGDAELLPDLGIAHGLEPIHHAVADIVGVVQAAAIGIVGLVDRPAILHATGDSAGQRRRGRVVGGISEDVLHVAPTERIVAGVEHQRDDTGDHRGRRRRSAEAGGRVGWAVAAEGPVGRGDRLTATIGRA